MQFQIEVRTLSSTWSLSRRYREFEALNAKLHVRLPAVAFPSLPDKTAIGSTDLPKRLGGLDAYLTALLDLDVVVETQEMKMFLAIDAHGGEIPDFV